MNPPHSAAISARPASLAFGVVMVILPAEVAPECTASRIEYQSHSRGRSRLRRCDVPSFYERVYIVHPPLEALLDAEALANLMRRRWREIEEEPIRMTGT